MIKIKCYLYDSEERANGYRGEDLTDFLLQGSENTEDLTQELDTTEITLLGIDREIAFEPSTRFIIDITENEEIISTLHRVVQDDFVSTPILNEPYYKHEISLIEPSVIAQKHTVDNIACTYKLKDVSLDTKVTFDLSQQASFISNLPSQITPSRNFGFSYDMFGTKGYFGKYFEWEGNIKFNNSTNYYNEYQESTSGNATITLPKLAIYLGKGNTQEYVKIGYASIHYDISEWDVNGTATDNRITGEIISNDNLNANGVNGFFAPPLDLEIAKEYITEKIDAVEGAYHNYFCRKYTDTSFSAPNYTIALPFTINPNCYYKVLISLTTFPTDNTVSTVEVWGNAPIQLYEYSIPDYGSIINKQQIDIPFESFQTGSEFFVYATSSVQQVIASAQPYSALLFLQKAIANSKLTERPSFTYSANINFYGQPNPLFIGRFYNSLFYIDDNFVDELAKTSVIENFYHQKNLWEILIEVGYYIHAIPEIKFGDQNKLMITFNKLGETTETSGDATPIMISNFRGIDDYISEVNSYVSNMVQLGGQIEEIVAPKSSSEDYLVYNDVAEIKVSKPIIELLSLKVKPNNEITWGTATTPDENGYYDMTKFIYEYNVYKLLSINYNDEPNKGIAMYYNLRDSKIYGGNYQLPQANTNIYSDYAFKKIIYCAITGNYPDLSNPIPTNGYWKDIQINDFTFKVTYRAQDNVRQTYTRPDIRKYLTLNYDFYNTIPHWQQFANQEDIVVDSEKYGSNMFGKLIRTGNNNYQMQEWVDTPTKLKQKGEIKKIKGEIYYVSKIKNTFFVDKIESIVTYSKDYNQLSKVVGIPSEPRFYEISEQSMINREVAINDYLVISDKPAHIGSVHNKAHDSKYLTDLSHLKDILFGLSKVNYSKYAITTFKGDKDIGIYSTTYGMPDLKIDLISPINAYASGNTLTYSWGMLDNFSAGDCIVDGGNFIKDQVSTAYKSLQAVQYTDKYGKATMFDFFIVSDLIGLTTSEIQALPKSFIDTSNNTEMNGLDIIATNVSSIELDTHQRGLVLIKDCREKIDFNYNLQAITGSDTFVTSPFLFQVKDTQAQLVLLNKEVNKLSNGYFDTSTIIGEPLDFSGYIEYTFGTNAYGRRVVTAIKINLADLLSSVDTTNVKAIALTYDFDRNSTLGKNKFIIAQNLPTPTINDWYIGSPNIPQLFNK